ncbi:MAG: hypothetical protein N2558_04860, partial [Patescibacteria group bacterium]|nr:hypothetical protein [Patescibacteria group bacterium]
VGPQEAEELVKSTGNLVLPFDPTNVKGYIENLRAEGRYGERRVLMVYFDKSQKNKEVEILAPFNGTIEMLGCDEESCAYYLYFKEGFGIKEGFVGFCIPKHDKNQVFFPKETPVPVKIGDPLFTINTETSFLMDPGVKPSLAFAVVPTEIETKPPNTTISNLATDSDSGTFVFLRNNNVSPNTGGVPKE